jgi:hypothetical protein
MAEVAGPGQFSKRTDKAVGEANRSLPNADYGEQAAYQDQRQGAQVAQSAGGSVDFASLFGDPASRVVGLNAPSAQPDIPVTDGAAMGAGRGEEALGLVNQREEDLQSLAAYLPVLEFMANQPGASWAMRNTVRKVKASQ